MKNIQEYKKYFQNKKLLLREVINASAKTKYGKGNKIGLYSIKTYEDFCRIPFSDSKMLSENPTIFVRGKINNFLCQCTSGTTGHPKEIYQDQPNRLDPFPSSATKTLSQTKNLTFLCGKGRKANYWWFDFIFKKCFPHIKMLHHDDTANSVTELAQQGDSIFIADSISFLKYAINLLEKEIKKNKSLKDKFKKKIVYACATGDKMTIKELKDIYIKLENIFSVQKPLLVSTYGLTETQSVGFNLFEKKMEKVRHRVVNLKFVEVIDKKSKKPTFGDKGEIVTTSLGWTTGTIIPRYRTGDIGIMKFKDGIPYLEVDGKEASAGHLRFRQVLIDIPGTTNRIKKKFKVPIYLKSQIIRNNKTMHEILSFIIHSPAFNDKNLQKRVKNFVEAIVPERKTILLWGIKNNLCKINVKLSSRPSNMVKDWQILPLKII